MLRLLFILTLALVGCGKLGLRHPATPASSHRLGALRALYAENLQSYEDQTKDRAGWPSLDCDGAMWAGIARRAGIEVDVSLAISPEGRPLRRPGADCLPPESASTTSNDMMTGIILGLVAQKDLAALEALWNYGVDHNWSMGSPSTMIARVVLKPNGISLLARAIYSLGGPSFWQRKIPVEYTPGVGDFEAHLQYLSLTIQHDVGSNPKIGEAVVCRTASHDDALAMAVCGDKGRASELLLGDYQYPSYVRGANIYRDIHWLFAAKMALE